MRQKTKKALEKQDNLTSDTHDGDSNLNESVEAFIDPVKNSIDLNDNDGKDSSFNNNAKPLHNLLEATHKVFPEVNGNEVVVNAMEIMTTIPVTPDPLSPDGVVNADGQAEVTSNNSTAVRAEDSSMKQSTLPSGVESMAAVPKDLRPTNTMERMAFTEFLQFMFRTKFHENMRDILREPCSADEQAKYTKIQRADLEECLQEWRDKVTKCDEYSGKTWKADW